MQATILATPEKACSVSQSLLYSEFNIFNKSYYTVFLPPTVARSPRHTKLALAALPGGGFTPQFEHHNLQPTPSPPH